MADLTWRRFALDADPQHEPLAWELARDGKLVLLRERHGDQALRCEQKRFISDVHAERYLESRIEVLRQDGYRADGTVAEPSPAAQTQARQDEEDEATVWNLARLRFDDHLPSFVEKWRALGFDLEKSFVRQCRGTCLRPDEIVEHCLDLAGSVFSVHFARRSRCYDAEHGRAQSIPRRLLAEFYIGPPAVLTIVYSKLRHESGSTDDADIPGFADEVLLRMRSMG